MALRYIDGFDHENTAATSTTLIYKGPSGSTIDSEYSGAINTVTSVPTPAWEVGGCAEIRNNEFLTKVFDNQNTWLTGFHVYLAGNSGSYIDERVLNILDGSTVQVQVYYNGTTKKFEVYRGDKTTLLGTSTNTFDTVLWYWLEFKVLLHGSTGTVELRVNGITEVALIVGDQNTAPSGNNYANRIKLQGPVSTGATYFDNWFIADGAAGLNDFQGECRIITKYPASDSSIAWTKSAGATNTSCVDEAQANTTDYVSSSTPTQIDKYAMSAVGILGTIKGAQVCVVGCKDDAQVHTIRTKIDTGTVRNGDTYPLDANYRTFTKLYELNPEDSAAWEVADIDAALVGMELVS